MKQLIQSLSNGELEVVEAPDPILKKGSVISDTTVSLVSAGTERMLLEFGRSNLLTKAKSQPEKVKQVISKMSTDGIFETISAVQSKLMTPIPLGYSNVGVVRASAISQYKAGDRIVSNAAHATTVCVNENLLAKTWNFLRCRTQL